jgi:hypothetical protein
MGDLKGLSYCQDVCLKEWGCLIALLIGSCGLGRTAAPQYGREGSGMRVWFEFVGRFSGLVWMRVMRGRLERNVFLI